MLTDLVLSPFGADPADMVTAAVAADAGFAGIYTFDHFSGVVLDRPWSRDPFVTLGAIATATRTARLGVLVANMVNRHPVQLASAVNTLQALAPGRAICGIGSGAAPRSGYAAEHEMIGRALGDGAHRRAALVETIAALRATWAGTAFPGVVDGAPAPPIVVGASGPATIALAAEHADGVNIHRSAPHVLAGHVALARSRSAGRPFEISVFDALDAEHDVGGDPAPLIDLGVDRRTLWVVPPYPFEAIARIAAHLRDAR